MLNYSTKARESLAVMAKALRAAPLDPQVGPGMVRDILWIDHLLDVGVKFLLPDNGELVGDLPPSECLMLGRLPFPVTVVEFRIEEGAFPLYADAPYEALSRLAIGIDMAHADGRDEVLKQWPGAVAQWDRAFGRPVPGGYSPAEGMLVISIDDCSPVRESRPPGALDFDWAPGWCGIFLPYDQTPEVTDRLYVRNESDVLEPGMRKRRGFNTLMSVWELGSDGRTPMHRIPNAMTRVNEFSVEFSALAQLCAICACRNVSRTRVEPPAKLNKARLGRGRLPLYAHYTLTLDVEAAAQQRRGAGTPTGRTMPTHLRRGHIRRLPGGNRWINSTIVAPFASRSVDKTYRMGSPS